MVSSANISSQAEPKRNLLFSVSELQKVRDLLYRSFSSSRGSNVEFEIRFQPYRKRYDANTKIPPVFSLQDVKRIQHECSKSATKLDTIEDTVYVKKLNDDTVIRKIVPSGSTRTMFETKQKPRGMIVDIPLITQIAFQEESQTGSVQSTIDIDQFHITNLRLAKSLETPTSEKEYNNTSSNETIRKRSRTRYVFPGSPFEIHITQVQALQSNGLTSATFTEIEVEADITKLKNEKELFLHLKKVFLLCFPNTKSYISLLKFKEEGFHHLPPYIKSELRPINIQQKHFTPHLLHYAVTNKLDGVEYKLWFQKQPSQKRMNIILFNDTQFWFVQRLPFYIENNIPFFMAEVVETIEPSSSKVIPYIHIFDTSSMECSFYDNGVLTQRLAEAEHYTSFILDQLKYSSATSTNELELDCRIQLKRFFIPSSPDPSALLQSIRSCVEYMVETYGLRELINRNDGVIFEPIQSSLRLPILKWKFPSKVTIDFRLRKIKSGTVRSSYELIVRNNSVFEYIGADGSKQKATFTPDEECEIDCSLLDHLIGEFGMDTRSSQQGWKLHRIRWEKAYPNGFYVAKETLDDIVTPKTLPWVMDSIANIDVTTTHSFSPISSVYREQANRIKDHLIQTWCKNKTVLDIGSGKGGDLQKYQHAGIRHLVMVEPNPTNVEECRRRIKLATPPIRFSHDLLVQPGEESKKIAEYFQSKNLPKVDVVSLMLSLTHFYTSEQKLDKLVQTIVTSVNESGTVIGTVMNGEKVTKYLAENDSYISRSSYNIYPEGTTPNSFSTIITTHLHQTETAEHLTEALTNINLLSERLDPYGLTLTEFKPFCNTPSFKLDTQIIEKELIRMEVYQTLVQELVELYGPGILSRLFAYMLAAKKAPSNESAFADEFVLVTDSEYDIDEYVMESCYVEAETQAARSFWQKFGLQRKKELSSQKEIRECASQQEGFLSFVRSSFEEGKKQIRELEQSSTQDSTLVIQDGYIKYISSRTSKEIVLPNSSNLLVRSSSLLDKHRFAANIRQHYLYGENSLAPPVYRLDYEALGYKSTDPVVELYSSSFYHFFTLFCSSFPDVDEQSLGRFQDIVSYPSKILYLVCIPNPDWIQMQLSRVYELSKEYTIMLIVPAKEELLRLVETNLTSVIWHKKQYSSHLKEIQSDKSVPHIEYGIGIKRSFQQRQTRKLVVDAELPLGLGMNWDETRLFGLYNTFVYQSYKKMEWMPDHPCYDLNVELGKIVQPTSFLSAFLMSYLGSSYYKGIEEKFNEMIKEGYRLYEFMNSPLSLFLTRKLKNEGKLDGGCIGDIPENVYTIKDWWNLSTPSSAAPSSVSTAPSSASTAPSSASTAPSSQEMIRGLAIHLFEECDKILYLPQICADKFGVSILFVDVSDRDTNNVVIVKSQITSEVVCIGYETYPSKSTSYYAMRVIGTSRGVLEEQEMLGYEWYSDTSSRLPDPTRVRSHPRRQVSHDLVKVVGNDSHPFEAFLVKTKKENKEINVDVQN